MFEDLIAAWNDLKAASRAMRDGPVPSWPWDRTSAAFVDNLRLRDRTQAKGMRFASLWHAHEEDIRALVDTHRETFPEYHVAPKKGQEVPDPTTYMQSMLIMPRLIAMRDVA